MAASIASSTISDDQMQTEVHSNNNPYKEELTWATIPDDNSGMVTTSASTSGTTSPTAAAAPLVGGSRSVETFQDMEELVKALRAVQVKMNDVKERLKRTNKKVDDAFQNRRDAENDAEQKKMAFLRVLRSSWDKKASSSPSTTPTLNSSGGGQQRLKAVYLQAKRVFEEYNFQYNQQVKKRDVIEAELKQLETSTIEIRQRAEIRKHRLSAQSTQDYEDYAVRVIKSGAKALRRMFSLLVNYYNEYSRTANLELLEKAAILAAELLPRFQTDRDVLISAKDPVEHILHSALDEYNHKNPDYARSISDVLANLEAIPEQFGSHVVRQTRKSLKDELELYKFLVEVDKSQTRVENILYSLKPEYIQALQQRRKSLQQLITKKPQDLSILDRLNETDGTISYFEHL